MAREQALVIIDMINSYEHEDGERCAENARPVVPRIQRIIAAAREKDVAVVFVNDHYGVWTSDRRRLIGMVLDRVADPSLVDPLLPADDDPLVLKARHSIFYQTPLEYLLRQM